MTLSGGFAGTGAVAEWFTSSCGGTPAGTGNSIIAAPTVNTTYFVRYKGICNTTSCASVAVVINTPSVGGTLSPAQSQGCGPQTVNLSVTGINGVVTQWERQANCTGNWVSIGSSNLSSFMVTTPNQTSCYRVKITNGVCPATYSTTSTITVDKPAVGGKVTLQSNQNATSIALCPSQNALLMPKNHVGIVAKWQYSFGTSSIWYDLPNSSNQSTITVNGTTVTSTTFYRVVIYTELGLCTGQASIAYSSAFRITKKANCVLPDGSIVKNEVQTKPHLSIQRAYPNPASDLVKLEIVNLTATDEAIGTAQIDIMDIAGRIVYQSQQNLQEGFNTIQLDIHNLSSGLYFIKIKDANKRESMIKLMKE